LPADLKERLIAEYTLAHESPKAREARRERITQQRIQMQLDILKERQGGSNE